MNLDLEDSVALITSADDSEPSFGTGFVIHHDQHATYLLTCAHVVRDVGGRDKVKVGRLSATVDAIGNSNGCDLAILRVEGYHEMPPLRLCRSAEEGRRFIVAGFYWNETKIKTLRRIVGSLGEQVVIEFEGVRTKAWDLEIDEGSKNYLQPGYSGSPVVNAISGCVMGVVTQREGAGKQGLAISIESVEKIWRGIPNLLMPIQQEEKSKTQQPLEEKLEGLQAEKNAGDHRIEQIKKNIFQIDRQLQGDLKPDLRKALDWLSDQSALAKKASHYALLNSPELKAAITDISDLNFKEYSLDQFCWQIEKYLELVYFSILTESYNLLDEPVISPSLPISAYETALIYIKQRIPERINSQVATQVRNCIDYLIRRIS